MTYPVGAVDLIDHQAVWLVAVHVHRLHLRGRQDALLEHVRRAVVTACVRAAWREG